VEYPQQKDVELVRLYSAQLSPVTKLRLDHNGGLSRKWLQVFSGGHSFPAPLTVNTPFNGNGNQPSLGKPIVERPDSLLSEVLQKRHE
jgi:hypothetical protein